MKVIVPLAGKGTRLLPLTKRVPKPLVRVAGRPVMDYVMDAVKGLDVDELIVITGHLKDVVERYIVERYDVKATFVEQKTLDGTAGAINLARPYVDSPVLIIFVDTVFEADLSLINRVDADGIIWAKEVEDYQRFGVIVTDAGGYMTRIVEKPSTPVSRLANIGLQYIRDWKSLFEGIAHTLKQPPGKGGEPGADPVGPVPTLHHRPSRVHRGRRDDPRRYRRSQRLDRTGELRRRQHHREQHSRQERARGEGDGEGLAGRGRSEDRGRGPAAECDGRRGGCAGEVVTAVRRASGCVGAVSYHRTLVFERA
ncbi:MAG: hypothetical protein DMD42_00345 [Gemmatimonadetes bacterium]|nr:MAG: hypothetical protein DMD42_00345 [Gemmatimonadota bacterium]